MAGAPAAVADAADRGWKVLHAAWLVLGDRAERERYDEELGAGRRPGTASARRGPAPPPSPVRADAVTGIAALDPGDARDGLGALADWLDPLPHKSRRQPRQVTAPDVRGLFFGPCHDALARAGVRVRAVRLTEDPMPVEGLVVDQSPAPGETPRPAGIRAQWRPSRTRSPTTPASRCPPWARRTGAPRPPAARPPRHRSRPGVPPCGRRPDFRANFSSPRV